MAEIVTLLEKIPGGTGWAILAILVLGPTAIFSKTAAEKFGIFGVVARWYRNRPLRRIEDRDKQTAVEVAILERRVKSLEAHIKTLAEEQATERRQYLAAAAEDRKQWREALDAAEKEIEDVRSGLRVRDRSVYALYDWTIRARVQALDGGVTLPPIPEITFLAAPDNRHINSKLDPDDTVGS